MNIRPQPTPRCGPAHRQLNPCVYVTETFAAMLALYNAGQFSCGYVGNTEMAKHHCRLCMFLLRRAGAGDSPSVLGDIERAIEVGQQSPIAPAGP
jgi:hypothetical protein